MTLTRQLTSFSSFATTLTVACFSLGVVSAMGADAIDRQVAVVQARTAAEEVNAQLALLDASLERAQAVSADAEVHADASDVALTTASLSRASHFASVAVGQHLGEPATAIAAAPTAPPADMAGSAASPASVPATIDVAPVDVDAVVEAETTDELRAEAARLADVSATLDAAVQRIDSRTAQVERATERATLESANADLDEALTGADMATATAAEIVAAVGYRVPLGRTLADVPVAVAELSNVTTIAAGVDRTNIDAVTAAIAAIARAQGGLDIALDGVRAAHLQWVDEENLRRQATNERLMAQWQQDNAAAYDVYVARTLDVVKKRSNGWKAKPAGVSGSNGRLSSGSLCTLSFDSRHRLQCDAARALEAADDAYFADTGAHLSLTDSYRSYSLQARTYAAKPGTAARPGHSNHGWGMAVDLNPSAAAWLRANGEEFGWVHPRWARPGGSRPESWHLEFVAPDIGAYDGPQQPVQLEMVESVLPAEGGDTPTPAVAPAF